MQIKIGVIIVNYNSANYLQKTLACLAKQTYPAFRIIVLDNNSQEIIPEHAFPAELNIQFIQAEKNLGFAGGNNLASQYAQDCDWIALLNPDAFPEDKWLEALAQATCDYPDHAFFASKLLKANKPTIFDGSGDQYHISGKAWRRDFEKLNLKQRELPEEIFAPCAAAALYRQDAWLAAEGFDVNYFCYFEDVDLAFRLRLLGYRCQYIPNAIAHHVGSAVTQRHSDFYIYFGQRNMVWTYFKNMPGFLFWIYLPFHLSLNIAAIIMFSLKGRSKIILKSKWDAIKGLPRILRQRRKWQSRRAISSWSIRSMLSKGLPWQKT
jgi:GT2 family glycosyltransferase